MMLREELIERMAAAMYEAKFAHDWKWCGSFREAFIGKAETALQALLASLPTGIILEQDICGKDFNGKEVMLEQRVYDERAEYYKQLLEMKK